MPDTSMNEKLDEILAEYVTAEESGKRVSRDDLLKQHPELADELRTFFADRDLFKRLASPLSPEAARRNDLPATVRYFGDYELLEEIAQGGMGVVYKARQTSLNRIVAVKMILAGHLATDADVKRFTDEARTAASLKHKAIVPIHEVGQQNGQHYFSMDLIEGRNLAEVIRTDPPEPKEAARIVKAIAEAIDYAHSEGVVHRDIKPSNILLDASGQVHITDFGLALRVEGDSELTRTGQVLGTPAYMPPEQARGLRALVGPGSDIYALGAVLYELLTCRPPFRSETAADTIRQLLDSVPTSPRRLERRTPRDLETICLKCLEKEPHKRYGTAGLLADDLGRYLAGAPILARPPDAVRRVAKWVRRQPAAAASIVATILAIAATTGTVVALTFNHRLTTALDDANSARQNEERLRAEKEQLLQEAVDARRQSREFMYSAHIVLAEQAIKSSDVKHAYELLAPFRNDRPDLRGPMWHRWWRKIRGEDIAFPACTAPNCVAYSTSSDWLVHGTLEGRLAISDVRSGKLLHEASHASGIRFVSFSPSDEEVVLSDVNGELFTWQLSADRVRPLIASSSNLSPWLRDKLSEQRPSRLERSGVETITGTLYSETNGHRLTAAVTLRPRRADSTFTLESSVGTRVSHDVDGEIQSIAASTSGRFVAVGGVVQPRPDSRSAFIKVLDMQDSSHNMELSVGNALRVSGLAFAKDGAELAACVDDEIRIWNLAPLPEITLKAEPRSTLSFDDSGELLATVHDGLSIYDTNTGERKYNLKSSVGRIYDVQFNRGSQCVAVAGDKGVEVWGIESGNLICKLVADGLECHIRVRFDPASKFVVAGGNGVVAWDLESGDELFRAMPEGGPTPPNWRSGIAVSPSGDRLAVGTRFDGVLVYDTNDWSLKWKSNPGFWIISLAFMPDGNQIVGVGHDPQVWLWDAQTGVPVDAWSTKSSTIWDVQCTGDGRRIVTGHRDGTVVVWNRATGSQLGTLRQDDGGRSDCFCTVAATGTGSQIATNANGKVTLWRNDMARRSP